jgi:polyisoprenoid-binding protein YceI
MSTRVTATAAGTTWTIDPAHSQVEFAVRHLMISTVRGRFAGVKGTVVSDDSDLGTAQVDVTIDVHTIDTREAQRDAHLKSADFFDAEKFPVLTFKSARVTDIKGDRFKLVGDLTMHGVTREVTLDVTSEGRGKDPWGGERAGYSAVAKVNRSDFGLTWNQVLEAGGIAVGDEIKIALDLELVKQ